MTVTAYYSTDAHAPTVGIAAQAFWTTILTACLVNGYTGKSAAGWSIGYNGSTGQVAYQQGAGSNGFFLNVDDSAATANGSNARVTMFETMSAFGAGTNQTPTSAQMSGGLYWPRGNNGTASTAGRWCVIADAKRFYMWHEGSSTSGQLGYGAAVGFGDIDTYSAADNYDTVIHGYGTSSPAGSGGLGTGSNTLLTTATGCYVMRRYDQLSTGQQVGKHWDNVKANSNIMGGGSASLTLPFPNPTDGGLYVSPVWIHENIIGADAYGVVRGVLPGIWAPCNFMNPSTTNPNNVQAFDAVTSSVGSTNGKTLTFFNIQPNGSPGWVCFETSNTWS